MLKKIVSLVFSIMLFVSISARADEGMWLLNKLKEINEAEMQNKGLKLSADDIYNINKSCIKDAIVQLGNYSGNSFGGFCTAEIISDQGLLITNHHCGFDAIQNHATVENDILKNGFWAKSKDQELTNEGLGVRFLIRIEDVSKEVLSQLSDTLTEAGRNAALTKIYAAITKKVTEGTAYTADVRPFYFGSEFYLFLYQVYKDIRLVGAPPNAIGNYGGDTDNWMWPRHTGDFSMFRIYADKDNNPAPYSKDNVPYKPKSFLPISLDGVKPDDFSMIVGFPGRTERYLVSEGVRMAIDQTSPAIVEIRTKKLDILDAAMASDPKLHIMYAAKHNNTSNYWKYYIGQAKQLKRNRVVESKTEQENNFTKWLNADASRKAKYGSVLSNLKADYEEARTYNVHRTYLREAVQQGPEILMYAYSFDALNKLLNDKAAKPEDIKKAVDGLKENVEDHFKECDAATDKKLFAVLIKLFHDSVPAAQLPSSVTEAQKKYDGDFGKWADAVYEKSIFDSKEEVLAFLNSPSAKKLSKDPAYMTAANIMENYMTNYRAKVTATDQKISKDMRLYVQGLREMMPDKKFYPDANSTMRLSYGGVKDYVPADAVQYTYFTTIDGLMEKMDNNNPDFIVPDKLVELYKKKDYGRYAENGVLKVAYITTNDITGGNSGSGVLNGKGELTGLAFDGNWEAMSGDIYYDPKLKRCINVDIRYVLFIIEKLGGAGNLISEMKLNGGSAANNN